jgi:outer membrane protein assembly factor BamE
MQHRNFFLIIITFAITISLAGCIKPYQIPIEQGNILSINQTKQIHQGMSTQQVTNILGQPVLTNIYKNQLAYVYTYLDNKSSATTKQKLVVTFSNNKAIKIEKSSNL